MHPEHRHRRLALIATLNRHAEPDGTAPLASPFCPFCGAKPTEPHDIHCEEHGEEQEEANRLMEEWDQETWLDLDA